MTCRFRRLGAACAANGMCQSGAFRLTWRLDWPRPMSLSATGLPSLPASRAGSVMRQVLSSAKTLGIRGNAMSWHHVKQRIVTARKRHVCALCGQCIQPGWRYIRRFGYFCNVGLLSTSAMHFGCTARTHDWDSIDWEGHRTGDGEWPRYDDDGKVVDETNTNGSGR